MKMNHFKTTSLFVAVAALILSFGSCSKDDNENGGSGSASKTTLLTNGGWIIQSIINTQGTNSQDEFDYFDACEKDDITIFNSNSSITWDEGATKCDPSDSQSFTEDAWALVSNETKLSFIYDGGGSDIMDIVTLSSSELKLRLTYDDPSSNDDIVTTITFRHN